MLKRESRLGALAALALCFGLGGHAAAQKLSADAVDRTVLPVPEPKRATVTELRCRLGQVSRGFDKMTIEVK